MNTDQLNDFINEKLKSKLSEHLTYHGLHHTLDVLKVCREYIERMQLSEQDSYLLETAALFHDTGFLFTYEDHETESIRYAREILPNWGYSLKQIDAICGMIAATRIPQNPVTILEKVLADADLDYLGTDDFYRISETLYHELVAYKRIKNRDDWDNLQIRFLQKHHYHTDFAKKYRESVKQKHLKLLLKDLDSRIV